MASGFAFDVIGIGALNLDYIADTADLEPVTRSVVIGHIADVVARTGTTLEPGTEHSVDEDTIHSAIEAVSSATTTTVLGGSAFNAIHAIAQTYAGLRLGYVGIAGRMPVIGMSSVEQLAELEIDHEFVRIDHEHLCGICFSFSEDGDRTLLTHGGANEHMADYLAADFDRIVAYLATARVIHVTSFLDDRTAGHLLAVLRAVKSVSPATLICFDPGHVWSTRTDPAIDGIIAISDYLLVNNREFHEIGNHTPGDSADVVAARILSRFDGDRSVIVVKRTSGIWSFRREDGKVKGDFYAQVPLPEEQIQDSTGAGDVFAAGLLTVLTSDRLQIELGALLGMRLARHKLRYVGTAGHGQFAEVTREFVRLLDDQRRIGLRPRGVFISHGGHPDWLAVQRFIEERFQLPVYSFESRSWGSRPVTEALSDYLERCSVAICVLTAEDLTGDGKRRARQNVVHEVGLFQGRHGFDRVLVLAEDGCDFVPQAAAPFTISYPHNAIGRTFYQLEEMIRSQGFRPVDDPD